jgi:HEAT repeat protein
LHGDDAERLEAAMAIARLKAAARDALPALIIAREDHSKKVRIIVFHALGEIGEPAMDVLTYAIRFDADGDKVLAALASSYIGTPAIDPLIHLLGRGKGADKMTYGAVVVGLAAIGKPAIPELIGYLNDDDHRLRASAILALGEMGKDAKDAIPMIRAHLKDSDAGVREIARDALNRISPE